MTKTVYKQLLQIASIRKKDAVLRYTLAISLLDGKGSGWVSVDLLKSSLSELFNISPRTVYNFLCKMENGGFGRFSKKDRSKFFYLSQYNLSEKLGQEINNTKAVRFDINTLAGSPVQFRAWVEASLLSGKPRSITRQTRRDKISGTGKRTQRKYDKIQGVSTQFQYAIVGQYSDYLLQSHIEKEGHYFILNDRARLIAKEGDSRVILFQRANLYDSQIEVRKKKIKSSKLRYKKPTLAHTAFDKIFFSNFDSAWKNWNKYKGKDVFYPFGYESIDFRVLHRLVAT